MKSWPSRLLAAAAVALTTGTGACADLGSASPPEQERPLNETLSAYQAFARESMDGQRARELVAFMDAYVRLPGNTGFDASIHKVVEALEEAGYVEASDPAAGRLTYRIERRPLERPTWEPVTASLRLVGEDAPLLTLEGNQNVVAINSLSTPEGGVEAEVVDVGGGTPADFQGKDVRGKIVFGELRVGRLFTTALEHGAVGVIAYAIPEVNRPEENRDIIGYSSIPLREDARAWGLQLTTNARDHLRQALAQGPVRARVDVKTRVFDSDELTLVAEIRGATHPQERFVFSGHVQEAGANDNASGVAALSEVARVLAMGAQSGDVDPQRTITMIWGDEISSTARYLQEDPRRAAEVRWGLSLDMVGEDTDKTGGTFLIEKMPDPSAVWTRGDDHHTEWGGRPLEVDDLTPHYFNDFVLNRCLDQGADNGWVVRTNPYEGGSDHVPFLRAGIPGLLLWHFTDVYYHTDGDRLENVSSTTLKNAGVCAAVSAMALTTADASLATYMVSEIEAAALDRLHREAMLSRDAVAAGAESSEQRRILETWSEWYVEALGALSDVQVGGSDPRVLQRIESAVEAVRATTAQELTTL